MTAEAGEVLPATITECRRPGTSLDRQVSKRPYGPHARRAAVDWFGMGVRRARFWADRLCHSSRIGQLRAVYIDDALRISVAIGFAPDVSSGVRGPTLQLGDDRRDVADVVRSPMAAGGDSMVRNWGHTGPFREHRGWLLRLACLAGTDCRRRSRVASVDPPLERTLPSLPAPPRWGFPLLTRTAMAPHDGTFPSYDDSNVPGVLRHCRRFSGDSERPFGGRLLSVRLRPCLDGRQGRSVCGNSCDAAADATPAPIENSVRIEGRDLLPRRIVDRSPRNVARSQPPAYLSSSGWGRNRGQSDPPERGPPLGLHFSGIARPRAC